MRQFHEDEEGVFETHVVTIPAGGRYNGLSFKHGGRREYVMYGDINYRIILEEDVFRHTWKHHLNVDDKSYYTPDEEKVGGFGRDVPLDLARYIFLIQEGIEARRQKKKKKLLSYHFIDF